MSEPTEKHVLRRGQYPGSAEGWEPMFWCPGCGCCHMVWVHQRNDQQAVWQWNGSFTRPTFTPSLLVKTTRYTEKGEADLKAWQAADTPKLPAGFKFESEPLVCHTYVRDGQIIYLHDCTHKLAGQTVPMAVVGVDW